MYFKISWAEDFDTLMMHLWGKYGKKMFDCDGIGEQMDLNKFAQKFFNDASTTADVSVDANANVTGRTSVEYNFEMPKALRRYNSYFLLWKQLRKDVGLQKANEIIEAQINGSIYVNDFTDIAMPYSYHPGTTIIVHDGNGIYCTSMSSLFRKYDHMKKVFPDREEINVETLGLRVFDYQNSWTPLLRIVRHISHTDLVRVETKRGSTFTVTTDHPCILEDGREVKASELVKGSKILESTFSSVRVPLMHSTNYVMVDPNRAYCIGAMAGDGCLSNNMCSFHQKDVMNTPYPSIFSTVYDNVHSFESDEDGRSFVFGNREDYRWFLSNIGANSLDRHLPDDVLMWDKKAKEGVLAGVIDTDGCVNKHTGVVDVRVISVALIQQVALIATELGFDRIRTSLVKNYQRGDEKIISNSPMYRVSFVIPMDYDGDIISMSYKLSANEKALKRARGTDGRFESNEVLKIESTPYVGKPVYDITTGSGHFFSNGSIVHNCFNYSTYDILLGGLEGLSDRPYVKAPKSLDTFIRQVEQFMVLAANSTLGATGFADMFIVASHFVKKILETGYDGHVQISAGNNTEIDKVRIYVKEKLTEFIYTVNWSFRSGQSPFSNVSLFDKYFLESMCPDYSYEGREADPEVVKFIQTCFIDAMNEELSRTPLTFPVTTACFVTDDKNCIRDTEFRHFIAEKNMKFGFINIYNGKTSTLSSCCRLRSNTDNPYFNSFGAGSAKIGSLGVVTGNLPRAAMQAVAEAEANNDPEEKESLFLTKLNNLFVMECLVNQAKREIVGNRIKLGAAPLYTNGYMALSKQYSTFGVVGLNEAVTILGYDILTKEGQDFVTRILETLNQWLLSAESQFHAPHNCEQVPAEGSAVKLVKKDKMLGFDCGVELYSNQFIPLITKANMLDRIRLQGKFDSLFSGGAICHVNVASQITDPTQIEKLMDYAAQSGVVYWAINYKIHVCENHHTWVGTDICPECGKPYSDEITRVVGFFTHVSHWNPTRRKADWPNRQFYSSVI